VEVDIGNNAPMFAIDASGSQRRNELLQLF
jgi:hypothetical protein